MEGTAEKQEHYKKAAMQPIEVMQRLMTHEQFIGFLVGNFIKYRMRADFKGNRKADEEKAKQYLYWYMRAKWISPDRPINPTLDTPPKEFNEGVF